jgi:hypothetical protein
MIAELMRIPALAQRFRVFPSHLQQQPLLGLDALRLSWSNPEKVGIELVYSIEESAPAGIHFPRSYWF